MRKLSCSRASTALADASDGSQEGQIGQFAGLATRADLLIVDGGNGLHTFTRRLWQSCEELVLVSSTDTSAVLDTYAALKVAVDPACRPRVHLVVNMCADADEAMEVQGRIRRSCQRFLGFDLPLCHWLPADANIVAAGRQGLPFALSQTGASATGSLLALAESFGKTEFSPAEGSSETRHEHQIKTNQDNLPNRLNPGGENVDSEEDRSLFARC